MATKPLALIPDASSFSAGAKLVTVQDGAECKVPLSELPDSAGYNVRNYGATGDGVTDDSAAIAACFAAAPAWGVVVFPPGTYVLRSYITIAVDNLTILGHGGVIISDGAGQDRKFDCVGRVGIRFVDIRVDGLGLTSENLTAPPGFPPPEHPDWVFPGFDTYTPRNRPGTIHFKDCSECSVDHCDFRGVNWPVTILGDCYVIKVARSIFADYYAAVYSYFSDDVSPNPEDEGGHPQPRRVSVTGNTFLPGKYRSWELHNGDYGKYDDRDYTFNDKGCSGAIKFRGENGSATKPWNVAAQHVITGNDIRDSGLLGIELQGCVNDSVVANNTVSSVPLGISLSTVSRVTVVGNTIKDTLYASIECEGWLDGADPNNDGILIASNLMEGRDDYGRPVNWVDNFGIVIDDHVRNVVVANNVIKYHRTGVAVKGGSYNVNITGLRIVTNEQSGNGGVGPYPPGPWTDNFVQGIICLDASKVDIADCVFEPTASAWCRMVNLISSSEIRIRDCSITSNSVGVYIHGASGVRIEGCNFIAGTSLGGFSPAFIFIDSSNLDCADLAIRGNSFQGTINNGISVYTPSNTVGPLLIDGNDTRRAVVSNARFLDIGDDESVVGLITRGNVGGSAESNSIDIPVKVVTGTDGDFVDRAAFRTLLCLYTTVINLQAAAWAGQRKSIVLTTQHTVTINPASGETINGSPSAVVLDAQWDRIELESDGAGNWSVLSASPTASLPLGNAVVKKALTVNAGGEGVAIRQIASVVVTHDFGTIAAGGEATHGFTIDCGTSVANTPVLLIGWTTYFAPALIIRSYIDSPDHGTIRLYNPTGGSIAVGSLTFRALVIEPLAP